MASAKSQEILRSSVLDRLTGANGGGSPYGSIGLRELKQAVMRDLEWLLNTRMWWPGDFEELEESERSNLTYGLPDLSTYSWTNPVDQDRICSLIEEAVKSFEPRLMKRSVKVELVPSEEVDDFAVKLRIEAVLHVEPYHEPVSFDTDIHVDTGEVRVKGVS